MKKMTVQEMLHEAIYYESSLLAHSLYIGVQCGIIQLQDDAKSINYEKLPMDEIKAAHEQNLLKIEFTKLYAVKRPHHAEYAIYLAKDEQSVIQEHRKLFNEEPLRIYDQSLKRDTSVVGEHEPLSNAKTFWWYKQNANFPRFIGVMDAKKPTFTK